MKTSYLKFIASLVLFGSNGIIAARITLPSDAIVLLRALIGSLALAVVFAATRKRCTRTRSRRDALYLAGSGAAMGASWIFLYEAYRLVGVGISSLAYYCAPVLVMAFSPLLFKERLTSTRIFGFCVVLVGALLVNAQALDGGESTTGMLCGWMSAVMHAAMVVFSKKADQVDGVESSMAQLAVSFLLVLAFMACRGELPFQVLPEEWGWVLVLGLVNTGLGCYLYFSSFGSLSAQTVAVLGYLEPLSAVVLASLVLQEALAPAQMVGAAFILGGAVFSETMRRPRGYGARPSPTRRKPPRPG